MRTCQNSPQQDLKDRSAAVKATAAELGFDACGIAGAGNADREDRLGAWLAAGRHASMTWLERNKETRQDIRLRLPGAKSVVVVAKSYYVDQVAADTGDTGRLTGRVARYGRGRDYHGVMSDPVRALAGRIGQIAEDVRNYCSVDTGPVLERAWAQRAGVGWIGKNGLVVREDLGSWFFLGIVATTLELAPDRPAEDRCASCTLCLDACPTGALVEPCVMDARKCISYLTIEHRGEVPDELARKFDDKLFGCDACQEACPFNQSPKCTSETAFHPEPGADRIDIEEMLGMDEQTFNRRFTNSPVRRAKLDGIKRNARIVTANRKA